MNKAWKFLLSSAMILMFLVGCAAEDNQPSAENSSAPTTSENQDETPPISALQQADEVATESEIRKIPVIYSLGGGPCDIGGMVFLSKHPGVCQSEL